MFPIAVTTVLLILNFSYTFNESIKPSGQNVRLNAFRFATKMHEILIVTSLSAIVLNYVQYEILHGRGVPLGSMLAGFQITDVSLLWSPGFWATALTGGLKARHFRLTVLIVLMVLLGAIVGPASAILMLPCLSYWDCQSILAKNLSYYSMFLSNDDTLHSYNSRFYVGANTSTLFPEFIETNSYPANCNSTATPMPGYCPLGGLRCLLIILV